MSYRVFDNRKKEWVKDNIYLNPNGNLFLAKKSLFGTVKSLVALSEDRYIYHKDIGICDKDNVLVYEGDYIKAQVEENRSVVGVVAYAHELSAYVILCVDSDEFYTLGSEVCDLISVVGNVFNGYKDE